MSEFPPHFVFGVATSAYQIEGAVEEDGRGPSIWDVFSHTPGKTARAQTGDVACDHYHRYVGDVQLMKDLGVQSYRFSISWPRVRPEGVGRVNEAGLDFYDRLIEALLEAGIEPMATLYHWDLPQALQNRGGWTNRDTAKAFAEYADVVFARFGGRVSRYITVNEPWCSAVLGHAFGIHAPGLQDFGATVAAAHHLLLGHGMAVEAFRGRNMTAEIGITNILTDVLPASARAEDTEAAARMDVFLNRWFLDPVFQASYPEEIGALGVDSVVQPGDLERISTPLDFVGVNYYQRQYVAANQEDPLLRAALLPPSGERTASGWGVEPDGLVRVLQRVTSGYTKLPIYVTESGAAFADVLEGGAIYDDKRTAYLERHLQAVLAASVAGVDVRGYYVWSLLDNFEWAEGYDKRFGLVYVDYETQARTLKESALWYQRVIGTRTLHREG
ncbi:GH1 family beta-glucosidase [Alicyclobacillus sp. ALC3]|uniref:GH1 family beta-glucosidase n=1 Tax=Alicyclobacillus sp. ALC3 TaxID=2796143 RepID=UPI00237865E9|nr:GH1 family beta-glucosidase [Alicyclobacillus sp. ALC3]WDL96002.1 beta-glucosidase [Alicyclobacillus sp. ALC3]